VKNKSPEQRKRVYTMAARMLIQAAPLHAVILGWEDNGKKPGKCPVLTSVSIRMGEHLVASGKLGGKYTDEKQVLSEFRKSKGSSKWTKLGGWKMAEEMRLL
jgi:hypothetical protein